MEQKTAFKSALRPNQQQQQPQAASDVIPVRGGRLYVMIRRRLQELRKDHPNWRIVTQPLELNQELATFRAEVRDENDVVVATGHDRAFGENCVPLAETGAIGRAISLVGYGSDEVLERIEDE
jgi:sensor histidine kinase regulating citrate/malate metabolism